MWSLELVCVANWTVAWVKVSLSFAHDLLDYSNSAVFLEEFLQFCK